MTESQRPDPDDPYAPPVDSTEPPGSAGPPESPSAADVRRVVLASFVGTTIEWYDFFIYGTAAALVFDKLFFPGNDAFVSQMAAYGSFAIGFFARPLGGVVFGHFGDRIGRKAMLVTTLMMMGVATCLIGILPTYQTIGVAAPVLLVLLRLVQGFGVGGEWGGAVLMAVEHGHGGRRGLYGSCVQMGVPAGLLLATGVFAVVSRMDEAAFLSWGWRLPFLFGVALLAVGMFIRVQVMESPLFANVQHKKTVSPLPILDVFRHYPKNVALAMGARFAENACFYIFSVFILSFATEQLELQKSDVLIGVWIAASVQLIAIPSFGLLSDKVGRRPVYLCGAIFIGLFAFPFFWLVETQIVSLVWLAIVIGMIGHAAMYGPQAAFFSELFGTNVRYSGASIGYQLASPLAGGLAPLIATALLNWSDNATWPVSVYLMATAALTILAIFLAAETFEHDIGASDAD
ncbi:MFS transporter [Fuerstiella marisgermanici]|uniref:Inner membrane metabolite transport protein YhjE n=1 Tax=Fuerstiella marisgermanici TaxID=1891926 RepID=A0A1P8WPP8_9PLAN|nr:MFS transporter [Fuerstiella marisgermanici]APZ96033.1 Inner membrane metabolite transport protein YhjE [Fuerstiella marisgermanici]